MSARWGELAQAEPELAADAERIFRAFTLAYLATVRKDGGPRLHPVTVTLHDGGLYVFLVRDMPKRSDLLRDQRFALHSFPHLPERTLDSYVDDEVLVVGSAAPIDDPQRREDVAAVHNDTVHEGDRLFELRVDSVQHKTRSGGKAVYRRWEAQAPPGRGR